jgi:hypothetical protein
MRAVRRSMRPFRYAQLQSRQNSALESAAEQESSAVIPERSSGQNQNQQRPYQAQRRPYQNQQRPYQPQQQPNQNQQRPYQTQQQPNQNQPRPYQTQQRPFQPLPQYNGAQRPSARISRIWRPARHSGAELYLGRLIPMRNRSGKHVSKYVSGRRASRTFRRLAQPASRTSCSRIRNACCATTPTSTACRSATQQRLVQQLHQLNQLPEEQRERRLGAQRDAGAYVAAGPDAGSASGPRFHGVAAGTAGNVVKRAFQDLRSVPLDQRATVLNSARYQKPIQPGRARHPHATCLRAEPYEAPR